jgi:hypothetical protein
MSRTKSEEKPSCYLCGLEAESLASISGQALAGISCERCGEYYIDDFLVACGVTEQETDKAIISGFTK